MDSQAADDVIAFLRGIYHGKLIKDEHHKGKELLLERLKAEPKYNKGVPSTVLDRHASCVGLKVLSDCVGWLTAVTIYALESGVVHADVALLRNEPLPGMFPGHPKISSFSDRHFAVIKLPFRPYRGTNEAEHDKFFTPRGHLDLRGIVIEKISSQHHKPIIRLHLSVYDGLLRWYSIDSTGVMRMSRYGSAVGMTAFIDMGLFFNVESAGPEHEAYDSIDWCVAVDREELKGNLDGEPFHLIPNWLPELETVIRDTVNLNR